MEIRNVKISDLRLNTGQVEGLPKNPRFIKDERYKKLLRSIQDDPEMLELREVIVYKYKGTLIIIAGNMRFRACKELGFKEVPCKILSEYTTVEKLKAYVIKDNVAFGENDWEELKIEWDIEQLEDWGLDIPSFDDEVLLDEQEQDKKQKKLSDRFIIPPFSVLETKQGAWQQRKNYWLSLGIKSELGRKGGMTFSKSSQRPEFYEVKNELRNKNLDCSTDAVYDECIKRGMKLFGDENGSTSIFDPVLCELAYHWFNVKNGKILDPFAGGSVRGIVAAKLGFQYLGNDLRSEQIDANRINAQEVLKDSELYPTWTCGDSLQIDTIAEGYKADLVFSCPPYADLEVYSDAKEDISNMPYSEFLKIYREIIRKSLDMLKQDRFAVFVVGDVRDKKGFYKNFVSDTVKAFLDCGFFLYNEMILVNIIGSLAIRSGRQFSNGRKVGKNHQNVLVFYKGNQNNIKKNYKELDLSYINDIETE